MVLDEMIRLFLDSRKRGVTGAKKKCSRHTLMFYERHLTAFQDFLQSECGGVVRYDSIRRPHIVQLLDWLDKKEQDKVWSKATCLQMLRSLRAFFRWVDRDEDCQLYELKGLQRYLPVIGQTPQRTDIPERHVLQKFLAGFDTRSDWNYRDFVAASLLLSNGIRIGELCTLRLDGLKFEERTVVVNGKNGLRLVPIPNDTVRLLKGWLRRRSQLRMRDSEYVFVSRTKDRINESSLANRFKKHYERCGLPRITAHTFRHVFCTNYLRKSGNIEKLRCITGHSSYAMLLNYQHEAQMSGKELQAELERVHKQED
jgi:integrase/recombinase XerD